MKDWLDGRRTVARVTRLVIVASFIFIAVALSSSAEAKLSCWQISEGDLPHPIFLAKGDCGPGANSAYSDVPRGTVLRFTEGETYYRLRSTDAVGRIGPPDVWWGWAYYPATPTRPAIMIGAIRLTDITDGKPRLTPGPITIDTPYSGKGYGIHAPSMEFEATLDRYIFLGSRRLIPANPTRFQVIAQVAKLVGGGMQLTTGEGEEIDLSHRHGPELWDLVSQVRLSPWFTKQPSVEQVYPVKIWTGTATPVSLLYYPADGVHSGLIANGGIRFTPADLYEIPRELDRVFQAALGIKSEENGGLEVWVWPLAGVGAIGVSGAMALLLMRTKRATLVIARRKDRTVG